MIIEPCSLNTKFVLMEDAVKKALKKKVISSAELIELKKCLKDCEKSENYTDTVYFNNIGKKGDTLNLSGEFCANPLICEDITITLPKEKFSVRDILRNMFEFRETHRLLGK